MKTLPTRDTLIHAMADALQCRGLHGVGLSELLKHAINALFDLIQAPTSGTPS